MRNSDLINYSEFNWLLVVRKLQASIESWSIIQFENEFLWKNNKTKIFLAVAFEYSIFMCRWFQCLKDLNFEHFLISHEQTTVWQKYVFVTAKKILQNFKCTTVFFSAFCKICELNTEREIVFCFDFCRFSRWYNTGVISGSQMGAQLLQSMKIIKQTNIILWKIWKKYWSVSYSAVSK